jgi:hypothetical protein
MTGTKTATSRVPGDRCVAVLPRVMWQDEPGRLWDVPPMLRLAIRGQGGAAAEVRFGIPVRHDNRERTPPLVHLKVLCGLGDQGEPGLTVTLPAED